MNYTDPLTMKATLAIACLAALSSGRPAQAFDISFGNYDRNHDGRWDRREYYNADRDWHRNNDRAYISRRNVYDQFNRYDTDHNGYLSSREVGRIKTW